MEPATLTTERLVLSVPRASDVDAVFAACQDAELQRYTTVPVPYTRDDAAGFVDDYVPGSWADDTEYVFAVRAADDQLRGVVSWQRARGAVGYWMAAQHRGHGYLSEALCAVVDWAFRSDPALETLRWECVAGNLASAGVARAAGFRWVGFGPCVVVDRDGNHPAGWHAVLQRADLGTVQPRSEWPVLSNS